MHDHCHFGSSILCRAFLNFVLKRSTAVFRYRRFPPTVTTSPWPSRGTRDGPWRCCAAMAKKVTVSCFTEVTSLTATYHSEATSLVRSNCPEATSSVEQAPARHAAVGASTPGASTPRRGLALHSAGTRQQSHSQRRRSDKGSLVSCKRQGRAGQLRQSVGRSSTFVVRQ